MEWHLFLEVLVVPAIVGAYVYLRGGGIFKESHQGSSGILIGPPGSRLESLLQKADAHIVAIVIVSALLCALSGLVVAVSRGEADAPLACWLIAISGLLCRSALPLSGTSGAAFTVVTVGKRLRNPITGSQTSPPR
jgi:ABC-type transport system involved in cytochrome c biogenesis permease component